MFIPFWYTNTKALTRKEQDASTEQLNFVYKMSTLMAGVAFKKELSATEKLKYTKHNLEHLKPYCVDLRDLYLLEYVFLLANLSDLGYLGYTFLDERGNRVSDLDAGVLQKLFGRRPNYNFNCPQSFRELASFVLRHQQRPDWEHFERYSAFPATYVFNCAYEIRILEGNSVPVFASTAVMQLLVSHYLIRGIVLDDVLALLQQNRFYDYFFVLAASTVYYSTEAFFAYHVEEIDINDLNSQLRRGLGSRNYNFEMTITEAQLYQLELKRPISVALIQRICKKPLAISHAFKAFAQLCGRDVKDLFPFEFDYEIAEPEPQYSVSLFDSITKQRIARPARTVFCYHLQAFDGLAHKETCPLCGERSRVFDCELFAYVMQKCSENARLAVFDAHLAVVSQETADEESESVWEL